MSPRVLHTRTELRDAVATARAGGAVVGLVPTMGALHAGHLSLVAEARRRTGFVVVSIFVNPTQFGPGEDLDAYPRDLAGDVALLAAGPAHCPDVVFAPSVQEVYPQPALTRVTVPALAGELCGASRPGHFDGVGLVVTKLLHLAQPDLAVFGRKDFQQLAIVRRLVADLDLGVEVVGAPIVREDDGVAMSSRNRYLHGDDRIAARRLSRALRAGLDQVFRDRADGRTADVAAVEAAVRSTLASDPLVHVDYVELRDPDTLAPPDIRGEESRPATGATDPTGRAGPPEQPAGGRLLVAIAAHVGPARLIDNVVIGEPDDEARLVAATS